MTYSTPQQNTDLLTETVNSGIKTTKTITENGFGATSYGFFIVISLIFMGVLLWQFIRTMKESSKNKDETKELNKNLIKVIESNNKNTQTLMTNMLDIVTLVKQDVTDVKESVATKHYNQVASISKSFFKNAKYDTIATINKVIRDNGIANEKMIVDKIDTMVTNNFNELKLEIDKFRFHDKPLSLYVPKDAIHKTKSLVHQEVYAKKINPERTELNCHNLFKELGTEFQMSLQQKR